MFNLRLTFETLSMFADVAVILITFRIMWNENRSAC